MKKLCACGQPLHFSSLALEEMIAKLVSENGECVRVTTPDGQFLVQRYYIALHGVSAQELPSLAKQGIVKQLETPPGLVG